MTRNATKEIAKKTAHAEACCQKLIEAVGAIDEDMWNLLPAATQEHIMVVMDWDKLQGILAIFKPEAPSPVTQPRAPSPVPTLACENEDDTQAPPSEAGTICYDAEVRLPSEAGTICYDADDSVTF